MRAREFERLFGILMAAYPQREISATTIAVFTERFAPMDARLFSATVQECIDSYDWMPSVQQVRQAASRVLVRAGVLPPGPVDAWAAILGVARTWHEGASIQDRLPQQVREALGAAGGIRAVAQADGEYELERIERRFSAAYQQYREALEVAALQARYTDDHALGAAQRDGVRAIGTGNQHATRY